ncbi:MAG: hypothetical protein H8E66_16735 [Planctomycetes bacterium]|nr:hypothetical protein [Planctomycetota bacterium]
MDNRRLQLRLATLFRITTVIACVCGFLHAAGVEGMLVMMLLAAIPAIAVLVARVYVRIMSVLFDTIIGPFLLR